MNRRVAKLKQSPVFVRAAPFLIFYGLTLARGFFSEREQYWLYLVKTLVAAWMIWDFRRYIMEMRWKFSWEAVVVGIVVFVMWVGLGPLLNMLGVSSQWIEIRAGAKSSNPFTVFSAWLAWMFIIIRIVGSSVVVPPLEEVFFRSFVYRYIAKPDFQLVPIGQFFWTPFIVTSVLFGFEHVQWFAGILCGFAYQGLVCWKKRLGDAITAHAITNFLLGIWVVHKGAWHFW